MTFLSSILTFSMLLTCVNSTLLKNLTSKIFIVNSCNKTIDKNISTIQSKFSNLPDYIKNISYGQFRFHITSYTYLYVDCYSNSCNLTNIQSFINNTVDDHQIILLPPMTNRCPWVGLGQMSCGSKCTLFINSDLYGLTLDTVVHELGHNWGLSHSSTQNYESGDLSCIMSGANGIRFFNAPQLYALGLTSFVADIESYSFNSQKTFYFQLPSVSSSSKNVIRLRHSLANFDNGNIYISFRTKYGYDYQIGLKYINTVSIHLYSNNLASDPATNPILISVLNIGSQWTFGNTIVNFIHFNNEIALISITYSK